ncbi:uncharacterized protein LOC126325840 [Schistocerca gregaria]|uniref:uncharacterized protein LOC126325840 n=1 Tax=Schistocerca gregaria TaxID=7010 RepID=UPI00211F0503|nr:uncharacterized protein LOC126325840 [Schistocerca gregaria]
MVHRKLRECDAKQLVGRQLSKYCVDNDITDGIRGLFTFPVDDSTNFRHFRHTGLNLDNERLVLKPDMCFGKRGKHNLVLINETFEACEKWINSNINTEVEISGLKGKLTNFLIERFVPHEKEYYLSLMADADGTVIRFSTAGGIEVEENWDKVQQVHVKLDEEIDNTQLKFLLEGVPKVEYDKAVKFIVALYKMFCNLDFVLLEMNPWCFDNKGNVVPLDMRAELDDCAYFKNRKEWGEELKFPPSFGRIEMPEEKYISELDAKTGASLKLTVLNPDGCMWTMIAGGGASVVFADAIVDAGYGNELSNYGEYSGAPNEEEIYQYAKVVVRLASASRSPRKRKALIIGGGIANFTDIRATFKGIAHALLEYSDCLHRAGFKIWVRRGGPNYKEGLKMMKKLSEETELEIDVYGPEIGLTDVVPMAIAYVEGK